MDVNKLIKNAHDLASVFNLLGRHYSNLFVHKIGRELGIDALYNFLNQNSNNHFVSQIAIALGDNGIRLHYPFLFEAKKFNVKFTFDDIIEFIKNPPRDLTDVIADGLLNLDMKRYPGKISINSKDKDKSKTLLLVMLKTYIDNRDADKREHSNFFGYSRDDKLFVSNQLFQALKNNIDNNEKHLVIDLGHFPKEKFLAILNNGKLKNTWDAIVEDTGDNNISFTRKEYKNDAQFSNRLGR